MNIAIDDLGIPEVKPAIELFAGVRRRKMSPRFTHADIQTRVLLMLRSWASGRGRVGSEWRFYFLEADGVSSSSLVPDVAYVSFTRLPYEATDEAERPTIAPDIAVEILSPGERAVRVDEKIALYQRYATGVVAIVDPRTRTLRVHRLGSAAPVNYAGTQRAAIFEDFAIDLGALFALLEPPRAVR